MSYEDCLRHHAPPAMLRGESIREGSFYRPLEKDRVTRRYQKDDDARFGYRLRPDKWRWRDKDQEEGLSVSLATCARDVQCAIHFHPDPARFRHVVSINLAALVEELGIALVATYEPVVSPKANPCHFNIVPTDTSIDDLCERLRRLLVDVFPTKKPSSASAVAEADEAQHRWERMFRIYQDVVEEMS